MIHHVTFEHSRAIFAYLSLHAIPLRLCEASRGTKRHQEASFSRRFADWIAPSNNNPTTNESGLLRLRGFDRFNCKLTVA